MPVHHGSGECRFARFADAIGQIERTLSISANRLLAFVEDQTKSVTQVELIASSLDLFAAHVEKLQDLANKGIHSEIQREGARRALLRTVFILDDIVSLRPESFPIKPEIDTSFLHS
jgi:hypothetical protein